MVPVAFDGVQDPEQQLSRRAGSDALLGAVCILDGRSLFVKMTGPAAAVDGQKAAFTEFCRSLRPVQ